MEVAVSVDGLRNVERLTFLLGGRVRVMDSLVFALTSGELSREGWLELRLSHLYVFFYLVLLCVFAFSCLVLRLEILRFLYSFISSNSLLTLSARLLAS